MRRTGAVLCGLISIILLWGCADTAPVILDVRATLILEYAADGTAQQRLAVFAEDNNSGTRIKVLRVSHPESGLVWTIPAYPEEYGSRYLVRNHSWAGSGTLYPPREEYFQEGTYQLLCTDLAGREASTTFVIGPEEAARTVGRNTEGTPPAVLSIVNNRWIIAPMPDYFSIRYLLFFDEEGELLFMDTYENFPPTVSALRDKYPEGSYIRAYLENRNGTAGLLLPAVNLPPVSSG
jgi:hypothetical protein